MIPSLLETELVNLTIEHAVGVHLSHKGEECADMILHSFLETADQSMRQTRGSHYTRDFAPLLSGFAILDQLGNCYRPTGTAPLAGNKSGVVKALHHFAGYEAESEESELIYLLRNCMVHESALSGANRKGRWAFFRYDWNQDEAVKLPTTEWDGRFDTITRSMVTFINPRTITDEVSRILSAIRKTYRETPDSLFVTRTRDEILTRYVSWMPTEEFRRRADDAMFDPTGLLKK